MSPVFAEPDFGSLPPGTGDVFTTRLSRLPLERVRRRLDADAIVHNELQFGRRFCAQHRLAPHDATILGTWHLRAVLDRLSAARPDLVPARPTGATGTMIHLHQLSRVEQLRWRWRRLRPNFLVGWPTWFKNRWSRACQVWVRRRAKQLRFDDDMD